VELAGLLLFLVTVYYVLTNVRLNLRDVLPGAVTAALILGATFQVLGIYLNLVSHDLRVLQALGGPVILLFWLYVMANVIVFGAEVNWWVGQHRAARAIAAPAPQQSLSDAPTTTALELLPQESEPSDTAPTSSELR